MYTTVDVCNIFNIGMGILRDEIDRGYLEYDIKPIGQGKRGFFTYNSVFKIGMYMALKPFLKRKHASYIVYNTNQINVDLCDSLKLSIYYKTDGTLDIHTHGHACLSEPFCGEHERWMPMLCVIDMQDIGNRICAKINQIKPGVRSRRIDNKDNQIMSDIVTYLKCMKVTTDTAVSKRFGYSRTIIRPVKRRMLELGMLELVGKVKYKIKGT